MSKLCFLLKQTIIITEVPTEKRQKVSKKLQKTFYGKKKITAKIIKSILSTKMYQNKMELLVLKISFSISQKIKRKTWELNIQ